MHDNDLKIAICGAPGAGKTALAKALSSKLTIPLIYQGTKELRATVGDIKKMPPFWRMNEIQRAMYQLNLINYRMDIESKYDSFVADGCAIDLLTWFRMCSWLIPLDQKTATMKALQGLMGIYTHIVYLPSWDSAESPKNSEEELYAVDPFNALTADYITKGIVSFLMHAGKLVYVVTTPPFMISHSSDVDNVQLAVDTRVDEVLKYVLSTSTALDTQNSSVSVQ